MLYLKHDFTGDKIMVRKNMTVAAAIEYLHTTKWADTVHQVVEVSDMAKLDFDGVPVEDKYHVVVYLNDFSDPDYFVRINFVKARDASPFFFRSLDRVFNDILFKRDSTLKMLGNRFPF
jgi:hypothetical protein